MIGSNLARPRIPPPSGVAIMGTTRHHALPRTLRRALSTIKSLGEEVCPWESFPPTSGTLALGTLAPGTPGSRLAPAPNPPPSSAWAVP
jgi:hypothetical protein